MTAWRPLPLRTHLLSPGEEPAEVVRRYAVPVAEAGDVVCLAESALAVLQGRAVPSETVRPCLLARLLCRLPDPAGSLATPQAMHLAIAEVGTPRILAGVVAAGLGRLLGRRGDFYRVAGRSLAQIDDIAGTLPPYDRCVVLGPKEPEAVVTRIKAETGLGACVTDVNDLGRVDILAATPDVDREAVAGALRRNPHGNADERTPLVLLRREEPRPGGRGGGDGRLLTGEIALETPRHGRGQPVAVGGIRQQLPVPGVGEETHLHEDGRHGALPEEVEVRGDGFPVILGVESHQLPLEEEGEAPSLRRCLPVEGLSPELAGIRESVGVDAQENVGVVGRLEPQAQVLAVVLGVGRVFVAGQHRMPATGADLAGQAPGQVQGQLLLHQSAPRHAAVEAAVAGVHRHHPPRQGTVRGHPEDLHHGARAGGRHQGRRRPRPDHRQRHGRDEGAQPASAASPPAPYPSLPHPPPHHARRPLPAVSLPPPRETMRWRGRVRRTAGFRGGRVRRGRRGGGN